MSIQKIIMAGITVVISACSLTKVEVPPTIVTPEQFDYAHQGQAHITLSQWWLSWQDPVLSHLIEEGMKGSKDIAIAKARLLEAQANSGLAKADLGPHIGVGGKLFAQHIQMDNPLHSSPMLIPLTRKENLSDKVGGGFLGFTAAWEPDIFGAKKSDADAANAAMLAETEKVRGSQVMLASTLASQYLHYRYLDKKIALLTQKEKTLATMVRYLQGRFQAGQLDISDSLEAQMQLQALKAQKATLYAERDSYTRAIAVLIGKVPQGFRIANSAIDIFNHIPATPTGQMPSDVLERRPDIRAHRRVIEARVAQVASAKADLLPRFDIQFLGNTGKINIASMPFSPSAVVGALSVGVSLPIFTNGRIQRQIEASDARLKEAVLAYDKSVLTALAEVDNVYQAQFMLDKQVALLKKAVYFANKKTQALYQSFEHGQKTLDEALLAKMLAYDMHEKENAAILAKGLNMLNLYKALGGGWK